MVLRHSEFAQWCGTERTAGWHVRFGARAAYGNLHIPRLTFHDGMRFVEVSLGYSRKWGRRAHNGPHSRLYPVLPAEEGR